MRKQKVIIELIDRSIDSLYFKTSVKAKKACGVVCT